MSNADREVARLTHEVATRAIRRLDILEWVIVGASMVLALMGGALIAWLVTSSSGLSFRPTWMVASLLLFVVPGAIAIARMRKDELESARRRQRPDQRDDG